MMLNPWFVLGFVLLYLASLAGAGYVGWDYRDAKVAQEIKEATDDALQKARQQAKDDLAAATKRVAAEAAAQERTRLARRAAMDDALLNADLRCRRGADSVRLLNDTIDAANNTAIAAGKLFEGVRGLTATGGRVGLTSTPVGTGSD